MAARCSLRSSSIGLSSTPNAVAVAHQIGSLPPSMRVEHESPQHPSPPDEDFSMDILPGLPITTAHPIGHPQSACPNYIATSPLSLPFSDDNYAVPPSSHDDCSRIPRACHGVERRPRSRTSSRGAAGPHQYYAKLTRAERAMIKTAFSRRVDFAEHVQQIPSSSMWTAGGPALPSAVTRVHVKRAPTPIPDGRDLCLGLPSEDDEDTCGSWDERDVSSGFEGDVELESEGVAPRERPAAHAHVRAGAGAHGASAKERLTIVVPGGKSEAYVTMAFERSCTLADGDHDMSPTTTTTTRTSAEGSFDDLLKPSPPTMTKTGLKIKIPTANSAFMLSLRLASLCRVSDCADAGGSIFASPESEYSSLLSPSSSSSAGVGSDVALGSLVYGSSLIAAPESRVARRAARRAALAPYAICRSSAARTIKTRLPY